jgi:hypothetical protein
MHHYAERMFNESHRRLPAHSTLADWLHRNALGLRDNPYLRDRNEVVANQLLPLLEESPGSWEAIGFLNVELPDATASFRDYLHHWYRRAPLQHKQFIRRTLSLLGETVPTGEEVEAASAPRPAPPPVDPAAPQAVVGAAGPTHRPR